MTESPILFGPERNLLGILTSPTKANAQAPACLLLNVGVTHRVGPRRLNVKLARQLADIGVYSLRLDLSGIGDSAAAHSRASFRDQSIQDLKSAMDLIEKETGIRRFAVLGICSGASNGYWLAQADTRVVGLLMFDGFTFPTFRTQMHHDWVRLRTLHWKTVVAKVRDRVRGLLGMARSAPTPASIFNANSDQAIPSREEFAHAMESLTGRGAAVYLIYSGSLLVHHNYRDQLKDAFRNAPFLRHIRDDYWPEVDHIATPLSAQQKLMSATSSWVAGLSAPQLSMPEGKQLRRPEIV